MATFVMPIKKRLGLATEVNVIILEKKRKVEGSKCLAGDRTGKNGSLLFAAVKRKGLF